MNISKQELLNKYGIDLPKGNFSIEIEGDYYNIYSVKDDSSGCILVGINDTKGRISKSTITFNSLMTKLSKADNITIEII